VRVFLDTIILANALAGNADIFVTGNKEVQSLQNVNQMYTISRNKCLKLFRANWRGGFPNRPCLRRLGNRPSENFVMTIGNYF